MKRFIALAALALTLAACTDPITVGEGFLDGDRAGISRTTTIPFTTRTVLSDEVLTYDFGDNASIGTFTLGRVDDEVFGAWNHGVYLTPSLRKTNEAIPQVIRPAFADTAGVRVDSVVLILPIDTLVGVYGPGRTFSVRLSSLAAPVFPDNDFSTDVSLPTNNDQLNADPTFGVTTEARMLYDTVYSGGDTVSQPHIRILMAQSFVDRINTLDTLAFASDTTFWDAFPGVDVQITDESGAFVPIQPTLGTSTNLSYAGFYFFYTDSRLSNPNIFYRAPLNLWLPYYRRDYTGTLAGNLLTDADDNELTLVSGQGSLMTEITLSDLSQLDNALVNEAFLRFYEAVPAGTDTLSFPAPQFVGLYYRNDQGEVVAIDDRVIVTNAPFSIAQPFVRGERETDADDRGFYSPRLSVHLQRIVDGEVPNTLLLRVLPVDRDPSRVALRGPTAPELPATLTVTFTEVDQ